MNYTDTQACVIYMILMSQPEAHWFLKQNILLFHLLQIWITKTMFVNSDMSISFRRNDFWDNLGGQVLSMIG